MELAPIALITLVGIVLLVARSRIVIVTAGIFTVIGCWLGGKWIGQEIITGLDSLARFLG